MKMALGLVSRVDFWIYVVMAVIFFSGFFLCILPVRKVQSSLRKAQVKLKDRRIDGSYLYMSPDFLGCDALDDCWGRFLSNLELMKKITRPVRCMIL